MNNDSGFDKKVFTSTPYLKLIEDREGGTCLCYQMRIHGKLHFVKKIRPEFADDARMRAAFRKENELGYSLSHPNLPGYVFMEGIFSPEEYVVTEWIEGLPLDKFIENNPEYFSRRKNIARFVYQLTDALDYLHKNGIIHGDLKPANIMLSGAGERAILLDLGYSISDAHTLTGGYTYDFAAPELIKGESATEAADYYSLGKIIGFVENHTEGRLPKEFINLKDALTNPEIWGRVRAKEKIYKILEKKRGRWAWLTALVFSGLIGVFIIATVNKDSSYNPDSDIDQQPVIKEKINNPPTPSQAKEELQSEEPVYKKNDNKVPLEKTEKINIESEKEKIKEEVNRLLKLNYAPHINRIDSLTQANVFTLGWYFKIVNESGEAMSHSIKDTYYYDRYPSVDKYEVICIIANEFKDFCDSIWHPKLSGYREKIPR